MAIEEEIITADHDRFIVHRWTDGIPIVWLCFQQEFDCATMMIELTELEAIALGRLLIKAATFITKEEPTP